MDQLNIQPDALNTADTTQEIEGYEAHVEEIRNAYKEEDWRTPAQQEAERQSEAQQQEQPDSSDMATEVADQVTQQVSEQLGIPQDTEETEVEPEAIQAEPTETEPAPLPYQLLEDGTVDIDSYTDVDGSKLTETETGRQLVQAIKLKHTWLADKEGKVKSLLEDGWNLEAQAEAFMMVRNDPELIDRYDHNNDGQISYDDWFDTTHMAEWDEELRRLDPEVDARLTQEFIEGLQNKDAGSRLRAIWQQNGAGQNMARYILSLIHI